MANPAPLINQINAFNVDVGTTIEFNIIGGTDLVRSNILYIYELQHPSNWNRTIDSMIVEWKVHNLLHSIGYKLKRTTDVDLNNEDEIIYNDMVLKFILR